MQRQYLTNHVKAECPRRKIICQYCCSLIEHQFLDSHHEICDKFPLPCPNDCDIKDIAREDISDHRNICPLEIVQCTNQCGEEMERQQLASHLEDRCPRRNIIVSIATLKGSISLF